MESILPIFYYIIILISLLFCLVIFYHIWKYSYNKGTALLTLIIFTSVVSVLFIANFILFLALDFSEIKKLIF